MIGRNVYETILEQVEMGMCAKGPKSSEGQVGTVWRSLRKLQGGPRRWAGSNQVEGKGEGIPLRSICVNKDWGWGWVDGAAWWGTERRATWRVIHFPRHVPQPVSLL